MMLKPDFSNCLDWLLALISFALLLAVMHTFIVGKHYIIPTIILTVLLLVGNLAWYGLRGQYWAKTVNFWLFFLLSFHCFFALFWSVKYRAVLGAHFYWVMTTVTILLMVTTALYAKHNHLFNTAKTRSH